MYCRRAVFPPSNPMLYLSDKKNQIENISTDRPDCFFHYEAPRGGDRTINILVNNGICSWRACGIYGDGGKKYEEQMIYTVLTGNV